MTTSIFWLICLPMAGMVATSIVIVLVSLKLQMSWMRIFSEKQGIPITTMEGKPTARDIVTPKVDTRQRISIPVPGGQAFRKPR
jgi:hypothetical protein